MSFLSPRLSRFLALVPCLALGFSACADDSNGPGVTHAVVMAQAILVTDAVETPDGTVVRGIDLDGRVDTDASSSEGCFKIDANTPDGEPGIDNALGAAGPVIESFGGDVSSLIQGAINEGTLLILMEFEGVDDFVNDPDVTVRMMIGLIEGAQPDIGNDGLLVPGQSFDIRPNTVISEFSGAIVDGRMQAGTFDTVLPIAILDASLDLPILRCRVDLRFDEESGEVSGLVSGGVPIDVLLEFLPTITGAGSDIVVGASTIIRRLADLRSTSDTVACDQLSAAIDVRGVTAFVLRDAP